MRHKAEYKPGPTWPPPAGPLHVSVGDRHKTQSAVLLANGTLVLFAEGIRRRAAEETVGKSSNESTHTLTGQLG